MKKLAFLLLGVFFVFSLSYGNSNRVDAVGRDANVIEDPTQEELDDLADLMNWLNQFPVVTIDTNEIIFPSGRRWNEVSDDLEPFRGSPKTKE